MNKFEVGKVYGAYESGIDPIRVLKRTDRMCLVTNGHKPWRMLIRQDGAEDECMYESHVSKLAQEMYRWSTKFEEKDWTIY